MKWYEYWSVKSKERVWWTQRDSAGNCFEIRCSGAEKLRLFMNETFKGRFSTLIEAQNAAQHLADNQTKEDPR